MFVFVPVTITRRSLFQWYNAWTVELTTTVITSTNIYLAKSVRILPTTAAVKAISSAPDELQTFLSSLMSVGLLSSKLKSCSQCEWNFYMAARNYDSLWWMYFLIRKRYCHLIGNCYGFNNVSSVNPLSNNELRHKSWPFKNAFIQSRGNLICIGNYLRVEKYKDNNRDILVF